MAVLAFLFWSAPKAGAKEIEYSYGGEKIVQVAAFPQTKDYQFEDGKHANAGIVYK